MANVHHNGVQCGKPSLWLNEGESFSQAREFVRLLKFFNNLMLRNNLRSAALFLASGRRDLMISCLGFAENQNVSDYDCPSEFGRKREGDPLANAYLALAADADGQTFKREREIAIYCLPARTGEVGP